jgi:myxalamid-type polyketide synthase MxaC
LEQTGAHLVVMSGDVSQAADVTRIIGEIDQTLPPLRGIIHAAGVLADGVLLLQDWARFAAVFAPKVEGAWHLHAATSDRELDFFAMFSSITALLGMPGQANYAAANAFLDALAQHRRATGLPALSVNWGVWAEVGLAVQAGRGERMAGRGIEALSPAPGIEALDYVMRRDLPSAVVLSIDWPTYFKQLPTGKPSAFLGDLAQVTSSIASSDQASGRSDIVQRLEDMAPADRYEALIDYVRQQVAAVMRFDSIDAIEPQQGFFRLGMDSLMAVELRNRLQADIGSPLPPTLTFDYPTVSVLARYLTDTLFPASTLEVTDEIVSAADMTSELDDLSRDELRALLDEELRAIDEGALE